jgi:hypothetical protein
MDSKKPSLIIMRLSSIKDELNKYGVVDEDEDTIDNSKSPIDWYKTRLELQF